jgi:hypothetical protein
MIVSIGVRLFGPKAWLGEMRNAYTDPNTTNYLRGVWVDRRTILKFIFEKCVKV